MKHRLGKECYFVYIQEVFSERLIFITLRRRDIDTKASTIPSINIYQSLSLLLTTSEKGLV